MVLNVLLVITAFFGVYRSWLFHVLKSNGIQNTNLLKYLKTDFGNVNHIFIPYFKAELITAQNKRLIKKMNLVTILLYISVSISIIIFIKHVLDSAV
jgi:hypothetical protein